MIPLDQAGREMRLCLRRRNVRYNTEKSYMAWLRRFQAFLYPRSAMEAQQADALSKSTAFGGRILTFRWWENRNCWEGFFRSRRFDNGDMKCRPPSISQCFVLGLFNQCGSGG